MRELLWTVVEEVSGRDLRLKQHVIQSLPVSIAVEPCVLSNCAENRPGIQLVPIGQVQGNSLLVQVVRGGVRHKGVDVDVLLAKRKGINRKSQDLFGRKNEFEG